MEIRSRFDSDKILFTAEADSMKDLVEKAIKSRANLYGANLYGANLYGANLYGANLTGANLYGANLTGANLYEANLYEANLYGANLAGADLTRANLTGADLTGVNLYGADLTGANLTGADLYGANLAGANLAGANLAGADLDENTKLIGDYPVFQITPIGSRMSTLVAFNTDKGVVIKTGCFFGTVKEFMTAVEKQHSGTKFETEYRAAIELIKLCFVVV